MLFAGVKEVVLVRDPRDLLCSAKAFWRMGTGEAVETLATTLPRLVQIAEEAGPDVLVLPYEDLVTGAGMRAWPSPVSSGWTCGGSSSGGRWCVAAPAGPPPLRAHGRDVAGCNQRRIWS